jgi:hypothetical protein
MVLPTNTTAWLILTLRVAGRQKAYITLTSNAADPSPNPTYPELGIKVFAVYGGQTLLFGMPGGGGTNAWGRLSRTATVGANSIVLDRSATGWPVGGTVRSIATKFL